MVTGRGFAVMLCTVGIFAGAGVAAGAQAAGGGQDAAACRSDLVKALAGAWKAPQYKMKRASEIGAQVFGANSYDVRDVELTLSPSGEGVLKISTSVLDQKGKTWAPTVIESKVMVADPRATAAGKCEPAVTVVGTDERYLDETEYHATLDGSHVEILADPSAKQIDVRFEPPRGEGSFWSTLARPAARAAAGKPSTHH
jgi:hypothetical protein